MRAARPAVVIMDVRMPVLDGIAAAQAMADLDYKPRVILMTGDPSSLYRANTTQLDIFACWRRVPCARTTGSPQGLGSIPPSARGHRIIPVSAAFSHIGYPIAALRATTVGYGVWSGLEGGSSMRVIRILKDKGADVVVVAATRHRDAIRILNERRIGTLFVAERRGDIEGILSERDMINGLAERGTDLLTGARARSDDPPCLHLRAGDQPRGADAPR